MFVKINKTISVKPQYLITVIIVAIIFYSFSLNVSAKKRVSDVESQGLVINTELSFKRDENIFRTAEPNPTNIFSLRPKIEYVNNKAKYNVIASYNGIYNKYNNFENLNFEDHLVRLKTSFGFTKKSGLSINAFYHDFVEAPGTNNSITSILDELNAVNRKTFKASSYYGTTASKGQVTLGFGYHQYRYTNNNQQFRDFDEIEFAPTFFYRLSSKVRSLFQIRLYDYDYKQPIRGLDGSNKQTIFYTGIEWQATAKTSGVIKLGHLTRNFNDPEARDVSGLSFEIEGKWRPNTYTEFTLISERETLESSEIDIQAFINTYYAIEGTHEISPLTTIEAVFRQDKSDVEKQQRYNTLKQYSIGVTRHIKRWLDIKVKYKDIKRNSTDSSFDFNSKEVSLSFITYFE